MSTTDHYTEDRVAGSEQVIDERPTITATTPPWSPAQIVGIAVGIFFAVLGIAALVRTGFDTSHIYTPTVDVWTFGHSPLLAVIEIGYGVLLIAASVVPGGLRWLMGLLGAAAVVVGVVIVSGDTPARLQNWLAVTHRNGWLFVATGVVVLLAAIVSPVFVSRSRRREVRRVEPDRSAPTPVASTDDRA